MKARLLPDGSRAESLALPARTNPGPGRRHERGTILAVAMLISALTALIAIPFLTLLNGRYRSAERSEKVLVARYLAEAGVERAIYELKYGDITSWGGQSDLRTMALPSFTDAGGAVLGNIAVSVYSPLSDNPVVEATAQVPFIGTNLVERTLRVTLKRAGLSVFDYALFAASLDAQAIMMKTKGFVDSYNSRLGPYDPLKPSRNGDIGTNSTYADAVRIQDSGTIVKGDANSGPESIPTDVISLEGGGQVTGAVSARSELKQLPSVTAPTGFPNYGNYKLTGKTATQTISQSGQFSSFEVSDGARLTITGDVTLVVTDAFALKTAASIDIAEGASLKVYLTQGFKQETGAFFNNLSKNPTKLQLWGTDTCNTVEFKTAADLWGTVYAPKATMKLETKFQLYGALVCNRITLQTEAGLHYDEALGSWDSGLGAGTAALKVSSWQML